MKDIFRPTSEPARSIYDAWAIESMKRDGRESDEWIPAERQAVLDAAREVAKTMGLRVPTIVDVELAERQACGHVDYGAKWAYGVTDSMTGIY